MKTGVVEQPGHPERFFKATDQMGDLATHFYGHLQLGQNFLYCNHSSSLLVILPIT